MLCAPAGGDEFAAGAQTRDLLGLKPAVRTVRRVRPGGGRRRAAGHSVPARGRRGRGQPDAL